MEVGSGEIARVGGRAVLPCAFGICELPQCVDQRGVRFDLIAGRSAGAGLGAARIAKRFENDVPLPEPNEGKPYLNDCC
jgi:hypothetical protein